MDTKGHIVVSGVLSLLVGFLTKSIWGGVVTFLAGVLLDLDHLLELYLWYVKGNKKRKFVFLHAWEILVILFLVFLILYGLNFSNILFATDKAVLLGIMIGYGSHILLDSIFNKVHPLGYFIIFRVINRFDSKIMNPSDIERDFTDLYSKFPFAYLIIPLTLKIMKKIHK